MQALSFGDPSPIPAKLPSELRLSFSEWFPLKWDDCSTTANFLSQYFTSVLAGKRSAAEQRDIAHSVAYLANELLENAVKFRAPGPVEVGAGILEGEFVLRIVNAIPTETSERFANLLDELTSHDPGELLIQRIEANAEQGNNSGSGLGILTLMSDYGVRLTWNFSPGLSSDDVHLETIARLPLPGANT